MSARRGAGLVELLVTVALAGVMAAAISRSAVQHLRWQRSRAAAAAADEIVREVHEVLRAELSHAATAVRLLADTAIEIASIRGLAIACELSPNRFVLPASTLWWSAPKSGDSLAVIDTLRRSEWRTVVTSAGAQRASVACPSGGLALTLAEAVPATAPALVLPARIWRTERYVTYRSGDGTWWLGQRSCASACGSVQPITGPLLPPVQDGFRLAFAPDGAGRPHAIDVRVRADVSGRSASRSARIPLSATP